MKCDFCGASLSLEDENCPHCGQPNAHAKQHIEDMRRYQGEFEKTKQYVYDKTKVYTQVTVRMIILAVLVILSVALYILGDNAYSLRRDWTRSRADKKYDEYSHIMDDYLSEEDFRAFSSFCEAHELDSYDGAYAAKYGQIIPVSRYYVQLMDYLSQYAFPKSYTSNQQAEWTADAMMYFYKYMNQAPVSYAVQVVDDPLVDQAMDTMEENIKQFLIVYCGFTKEETESIHEMSDAKRRVLFEEKLEERLQNEQ